MRLIDGHDGEGLRITDRKRNLLNEFLTQEIEDGFASRNAQEALWRDCLQQYEGVPRLPVRNTPIENAPNLEVPLGAIAADSIYAQALDMMFQISPTLTVRPTNTKWTQHAKAVQRFVNWGATNDWNYRPATEQFVLDDAQLGTAVYYTPWVVETMKTKSYIVKDRRPYIYCLDPADFLVPGGATDDLQTMPWVAPRFWHTPGELEERATRLDWDISHVASIGAVGWVRSRREALGRTTSSRKISELYEIMQPYVYFDIDEDGLDEDLLVAWDRTSRSILKIMYNPFDKRPFDAARYQKRAHLFYGMGVVEMLREFQRGVTDFYNWWACNALLANARLWTGPPGAFPSNAKIWPGKTMEGADFDKIKPLQMADTYQSMPQAIAVTIGLAERRVGLNEMSTPRPSQILGSRTPGITAMSMLQQSSRRFTPAFDDMRTAGSGAIKQCLYRYNEALLRGGEDATHAERTITEVCGDEEGKFVIEVLRRNDFDRALSIELTASSASINRDADRQNSVILMNLLGQYYEKLVQLSVIMANPQVPKEVKAVASKVATAAGEAMDRTIRTFDQIRDPKTFIVEIEENIDRSLVGQLPQEGLAGLASIIGNIGAQEGQRALAPAGNNGAQQ